MGVWSRIFHTNYEFTVIGKNEDQEAFFERLVEKGIISLQNLSTHKSRRTLMGIDSSDSEPLTHDTVLYSVVRNEETFIDELTNILTVVSDKHEGKFIKKEDVSYLDILMGSY